MSIEAQLAGEVLRRAPMVIHNLAVAPRPSPNNAIPRRARSCRGRPAPEAPKHETHPGTVDRGQASDSNARSSPNHFACSYASTWQPTQVINANKAVVRAGRSRPAPRPARTAIRHSRRTSERRAGTEVNLNQSTWSNSARRTRISATARSRPKCSRRPRPKAAGLSGVWLRWSRPAGRLPARRTDCGRRRARRPHAWTGRPERSMPQEVCP